MADNVELNLMSGGAVVATDQDGSSNQHQYVKMEFGADGVFTKVDASNPLPTSVINGTVAITGGVGVSTPGTIASGSIAVTAGTVTLASPGTITSGTVSINAGTIGAGTINTIGTLSNLLAGSVAVTAGTVTVTSPGTITSGTVAINAGTIGAGTINTMGTLTNLVHGTVELVSTVTTVSNLTNGSIRVTAGTEVITSGSIAVTAGTVTLASPGTITSGTVSINAGTISAGTINAGTIKINPRPSTNLLTIGSVWGTTSGTAGTLVSAPGASTVIMINDISVINQGTSTLEAGIGFGTNQQGTLVVARGLFGGNGGIEKSYNAALGGSHVNLPLVMWTNGSGTASFVVSYWTEAQ